MDSNLLALGKRLGYLKIPKDVLEAELNLLDSKEEREEWLLKHPGILVTSEESHDGEAMFYYQDNYLFIVIEQDNRISTMERVYDYSRYTNWCILDTKIVELLIEENRDRFSKYSINY